MGLKTTIGRRAGAPTWTLAVLVRHRRVMLGWGECQTQHRHVQLAGCSRPRYGILPNPSRMQTSQSHRARHRGGAAHASSRSEKQIIRHDTCFDKPRGRHGASVDFSRAISQPNFVARAVMTLIITDEDVKRLLPMQDCIEAMRVAFSDLAAGAAVNRPRMRYSPGTPIPNANISPMTMSAPCRRVA
jgi:hypothetical protein